MIALCNLMNLREAETLQFKNHEDHIACKKIYFFDTLQFSA